MSTIKIRVKPLENAYLIRILIAHPMETGRRQDKDSGETIPAHYIQEVKIEHNGKLISRGEFGTAVSRDPYLSLRIRGAKPGDSIKVKWRDNLNESDAEEIQIPRTPSHTD